MSVIVTGAAGFIGSHITDALLADGCHVTAIDNFSPHYAPTLKRLNIAEAEARGAQLRTVDLAVDPLPADLADARIVFHCAAQPGLDARTPFSTYLSNNVIATQRLIDSLGWPDGPLRLFVYLSTSSVYGVNATVDEGAAPAPVSWYGVTKLAAEQLVMARYRDSGFPAVALRLYSVFGPRERPEKLFPRAIQSVLTATPFPLHEGSLAHRRSFTFVGDVVDAALAVRENRERCLGQIINIGSDNSFTVAHALSSIESIMGEPVRSVLIPARGGEQATTHAVIDKARSLLGFAPRTPLEDGVKHTISWMSSLPAAHLQNAQPTTADYVPSGEL